MLTKQIKKLGIISLCIGLLLPQMGLADAAAGRASAISHFSEADLNKQTLRWKIISSRTLVLYLQDLLPSLGNPYYHMAQAVTDSTLKSYNEAQDPNDDFMGESNWIPVGTVHSKIKPVLEYMTLYIAMTDLMKNVIQPKLESSIVVGSVKDSLDEKSQQEFSKAWKHISFISNKYRKLISQNPKIKPMLKEAKKKAPYMIAAQVAKNMVPHISYVKPAHYQTSVKNFTSKVIRLAQPHQTSAKQRMKNLFTNLDFKRVKKSLSSIDLPENGDINGADEAFEVSMRLEVGFELLQTLYNHIQVTQR